MTTITLPREVVEEIQKALRSTTVHLYAAVSLLEHGVLVHGGKKAPASDTMFKMMINGYTQSVMSGKRALSELEKEIKK